MSTKQVTSIKKGVKKETIKEVKQTTPGKPTPTATVASAPVISSNTTTETRSPSIALNSVSAPSPSTHIKKSGTNKTAGAKKNAVSKKTVKKANKKTVVKKNTSIKKSAQPKKVPAIKKVASSKKGGAKKEIKTEGNGEENSRTRFFKVIVDGGEAHGRFSGNKPKQAANKALTSILKSKEQIDGPSPSGEIKFSIIECTRGSKHKQYNYIGQRVKLDNPMKVKIGSGVDAKEIEYKFNNRVMKDKAVITQSV